MNTHRRANSVSQAQLIMISMACFLILGMFRGVNACEEEHVDYYSLYIGIPYLFYETTDHREYTIFEGKEVPIYFHKEDSNPDALLSLKSLKWNVLYPNSRGQIRLQGEFTAATRTFKLYHWYIIPPFEVYKEFESGDKLVYLKENLGLSDFKNIAPKDFEKYLYPLNNLTGESDFQKECDSYRGNKLRVSKSNEKLKNVMDEFGNTYIILEPATFNMGGRKSHYNALRIHSVTISKKFCLMNTEVTQKLWKLIMGTEPWKDLKYSCLGDDYPATNVSWNEIQEFIKCLNAKTTRHYRLPTEAEWEYACRMGREDEVYLDDEPKNLDQITWYEWNTKSVRQRFAHPVKQKKPNEWGFHDLFGNVREWCSDWYNFYPREAVVDPKGPEVGNFKILRGGGWLSNHGELGAAVRDYRPPEYKSGDVGFRLVMECQ